MPPVSRRYAPRKENKTEHKKEKKHTSNTENNCYIILKFHLFFHMIYIYIYTSAHQGFLFSIRKGIWPGEYEREYAR